MFKWNDSFSMCFNSWRNKYFIFNYCYHYSSCFYLFLYQVYYKEYTLIFINKKNIEEYHTIDSIVIKTALKKEKIEIIKIKEMVINHQILHNIYVGLIEECDYDFVLGPRIMGGVIWF